MNECQSNKTEVEHSVIIECLIFSFPSSGLCYYACCSCIFFDICWTDPVFQWISVNPGHLMILPDSNSDSDSDTNSDSDFDSDSNSDTDCDCVCDCDCEMVKLRSNSKWDSLSVEDTRYESTRRPHLMSFPFVLPLPLASLSLYLIFISLHRMSRVRGMFCDVLCRRIDWH